MTNDPYLLPKDIPAHIPKDIRFELEAVMQVLLDSSIPIAFVWLFGSYARGDYIQHSQPDENGMISVYFSDIDILVGISQTPFNKVGSCEEKIILELLSVEDTRRYVVRHRVYMNAMYDYHAQPIPIPIHYFRAMDEQRNENSLDGWEKVLSEHQIRVISVPGNHKSMMEPPHIETLGKLLSEAIRNATSAKQVDPIIF